jgi:hypothetical protein
MDGPFFIFGWIIPQRCAAALGNAIVNHFTPSPSIVFSGKTDRGTLWQSGFTFGLAASSTVIEFHDMTLR